MVTWRRSPNDHAASARDRGMFVTTFPKRSYVITTPSNPPLCFLGCPKSRSTKSDTTGPTSFTFVPVMRCAAAGANRSRPWKVSESSGRPSLRFVSSRTSLRPRRRAAGTRSPLSGPTRYAPSQTHTMLRRFVPTPGSTTPTCAMPDVVRPDVVVEVHDCQVGVDGEDRPLHRPNVLAESEIRRECDDAAHVQSPRLPDALQPFLDPQDLPLPSFEFRLGLRRACLPLLRLRLARLQFRASHRRRRPVGVESIPLLGELRSPILERLALCRSGRLATLRLGAQARLPFLERRLLIVQFGGPSLERLLARLCSRREFLDLRLACVDCRELPPLILVRLRLAPRDRIIPLLEFRLVLLDVGLGLFQRGFARLDVLEVRQESRLLFFERGAEGSQGVGFHGEGALLPRNVPFAPLEFGTVDVCFLLHRRALGSEIRLGDLERIGAFDELRRRGLRGSLTFRQGCLPPFHRGLPFREVALDGINRTQALLRRALGAEKLEGLIFEAVAVGGEVLLDLGDLSFAPLELLGVRRDLPLPASNVHLSLARLPLLGGDFSISRREVPRDLLHPLRRPPEFVAAVVEARVFRLDRLRVLVDFRRLCAQFRRLAVEVSDPVRDRLLAVDECGLPIVHGGLSDRELPFDGCGP